MNSPLLPSSNRKIDVHVGARVRVRRTNLGMTQDALADVLGLSNQQIQKYETGVNRVSAGRLYDIAQHLGVEVGYFFEALDPSAMPSPVEHGGRDRMTIELVRNFLEIGDAGKRAALAHLVKTLTMCGCDNHDETRS